MSGRIDARLKELGIDLPNAAAPAANYVPYVVSGKMVFVSGQIPVLNGDIKFKGKIGVDLTVEQGQESARLCALNLIAQAKAAAGGDLDRIARVVKLGGFVACPADFGDQPEVINGASNLMVDVFGDAGRHARFAVGANVLPRNVATEVEAIFELV
ncbi:MAG: RidA family protein [Alphaproteobacteria bacterium]|nr:RidA family protein [Alphaproteobacteria bacterium]MBU0796522.1 RidA family protein [Alphaproteobacteria bacterium]MBU0888064.1 RidA family protein [Alphaproteobacteria bacterium]MBU1811509.1 RidA family protein [Alphaproteobacteria bacterium]MBU2090848.1 RidA family protein [Alphaproteobacteria bacterium]